MYTYRNSTHKIILSSKVPTYIYLSHLSSFVEFWCNPAPCAPRCIPVYGDGGGDVRRCIIITIGICNVYAYTNVTRDTADGEFTPCDFSRSEIIGITFSYILFICSTRNYSTAYNRSPCTIMFDTSHAYYGRLFRYTRTWSQWTT